MVQVINVLDEKNKFICDLLGLFSEFVSLCFTPETYVVRNPESWTEVSVRH